jgi:hypothetical protein
VVSRPTPLPTIEKSSNWLYNGRIVFEILKKFKYTLLEKDQLGKLGKLEYKALFINHGVLICKMHQLS